MARTLIGTVTSDKGNKTIVINIAERKTHPLYKIPKNLQQFPGRRNNDTARIQIDGSG
jgi:ribosomal protein S17